MSLVGVTKAGTFIIAALTVGAVLGLNREAGGWGGSRQRCQALSPGNMSRVRGAAQVLRGQGQGQISLLPVPLGARVGRHGGAWEPGRRRGRPGAGQPQQEGGRSERC